MEWFQNDHLDYASSVHPFSLEVVCVVADRIAHQPLHIRTGSRSKHRWRHYSKAIILCTWFFFSHYHDLTHTEPVSKAARGFWSFARRRVQSEPICWQSSRNSQSCAGGTSRFTRELQILPNPKCSPLWPTYFPWQTFPHVDPLTWKKGCHAKKR